MKGSTIVRRDRVCRRVEEHEHLARSDLWLVDRQELRGVRVLRGISLGALADALAAFAKVAIPLLKIGGVSVAHDSWFATRYAYYVAKYPRG